MGKSLEDVVNEELKQVKYNIKKLSGIFKKSKVLSSPKLSGAQRSRLNELVSKMQYGYTGKDRGAVRRWNRLGAYFHVTLHLPENHGEEKFSRTTDQVLKYKDAVIDTFEQVFNKTGNIRYGLYPKDHPQVRDPRKPEFHFHAVLGKFLFDIEEKNRVDEFKLLPKYLKPVHALYFLTNPMLFDTVNLADWLEDAWRENVARYSNRKVSPDQEPLVYVTTKESEVQNDKDRKRIARHLMNPVLHVLRDIVIDDVPPNKVAMTYSDTGKSAVIPALDLAKMILKADKKVNVRWRMRGVYAYSTFQPIMDTTMTLRLSRKHQRKIGGKNIDRVMDLPVEDIHGLAMEYRSAFLSGDTAQLQNVRSKYQIKRPRDVDDLEDLMDMFD